MHMYIYICCRPVCSQWQQSGLKGVVAGSGGGCPMLVAEECVAELRGSSAPLHGRHPAHWRLHGVPNGTLVYAELKSLRNAYEPRTNIPAEAARPVILVFHGSMYSFIWRPSAMTRNGSSTSFFGTKPNGTRLVGLKPGRQYSNAPGITYLQIMRYKRALSSSMDFKLGWMQCATPSFTVGK